MLHVLGLVLLISVCHVVVSNALSGVEKRFLFHHHHHSAPLVCTAPAIANGHLKCPATTYPEGTVCAVICNTGFKHQGATSITCHTRVWTTAASCLPITCPHPGAFHHGKAVCNNALTVHLVALSLHKYGAHCSVTCDKGYKPAHTSVSCVSPGKWSGAISCSQITCPAPPRDAHGSFHCSATIHTLGSSCSLRCSTGYRPSNSHTQISCSADSKWSSPAKCIEIHCPTPTAVSHGSYKCSSTVHKVRSTCTLTCTSGYRASNHHTSISCLSTSKWSESASCVEIKCPTPAVSHGTFHCSSSVHRLGSTCSLTCASGFKPSNSHTTISCLSTSKWSTAPSCVEIRCPTPPKVAYGSFHCTSTHTHKLNDQCDLHCTTGYRPSTYHAEIKCLSSDKWSTSASCVEVKCPAPPKVIHGSYHCSSSSIHKLNDACQLHCSTGYRPSTTNSDIKCQSSDSWSTPAACLEIKCPSPPHVSHGVYRCSSSTTHRLNDVCHLQCSTGYKPNSAHSDIKCLSSDTWSSQSACVEIKCPSPPKVSHGTFHCASSTTHKLNDVCHLQCSIGYKSNTAHSDIKCLSSDTWSTPSACVEIRCPAPPKVVHGTYTCASTIHKLNNVCHLHCASGYKPSTTKSDIKCLSSDLWSAPSTCVEIRCPAPPKVVHGTYICASSTTHKLNNVCHLHCTSGYKPSTTKSDIKCLFSDFWSAPSTCVEIRCPAPPKVVHGTYTCASTIHRLNNVCHLHCSSGYKPSTTKSDIKCLTSDIWSAPSTCVEIKCPVPPKVNHGSYACGSSATHRLNDVCHLHCKSGYKPSTTKSDIHCLSSDHWSSLSACVEIKCQAPSKVAHGSYVCGNSTTHKLNDVCQLHCSHGYKPSAIKSDINCLLSDAWSTPSACVEIKCPPPPRVSHGSYVCGNSTTHKLNDVCHLECANGYKPSTVIPDIKCLSSDAWSTPSACVEQLCPGPPLVNNGSYVCNQTVHSLHSECTLHCDPGFKPRNKSVITCYNNETWSVEDYCRELFCPPPPSIPNGAYICPTNASMYTSGTSCTLQCDPGYTSASTQSIQCMDEEEWTRGSSCLDTTPPTFTYCPANQKIILETGETSTGVSWTEPKATDVPESNPVMVSLTSPIKSGIELQIGNYTVTYMAVDTSGNMATCSFFVNITSGCPRGFFFYPAQRTCIICPSGTYQDETSLKCVPCQPGLFTASEGSVGTASCREHCDPGSSSPDGLQPCSPCAVGSFEWSQGSTTCDLCPPGQTTQSEGSVEIQDCITL